MKKNAAVKGRYRFREKFNVTSCIVIRSTNYDARKKYAQIIQAKMIRQMQQQNNQKNDSEKESEGSDEEEQSERSSSRGIQSSHDFNQQYINWKKKNGT
jgi:hypothetical protein